MIVYTEYLAANKAYRDFTVRVVNQIKDTGLTPREWAVYEFVKEHGASDLTTLAERLCVTMPQLTFLLTKLEEKKLVKVKRTLIDRRRKFVSLVKGKS